MPISTIGSAGINQAADTTLCTTSGNVGIGTASPGAKLDVRGGIATGYASGQGVYYYNSDGTNSYEIYNVGATGAGNPVLSFYQIGTGERMRIDSSGNVGIGNVTAQYASARTLGSLVVQQNSNGINFCCVNNTNDAYTYIFNDGTKFAIQNSYGVSALQKPMLFSASGGNDLYITNTGNVLVGKTSTSSGVVGSAFLTTGDSYSSMASSSNSQSTLNVYSTTLSQYQFYVGMAGTVYARTTTISGLSDARLKENIRDLDDGLNTVMALKPRKFDWKEGKGADIKNARGFIAQEFETVFPDLIDEWKDPAPEGEEPYKSVRADLIPTLVKAIQELKTELDSVKAELAALKGTA